MGEKIDQVKGRGEAQAAGVVGRSPARENSAEPLQLPPPFESLNSLATHFDWDRAGPKRGQRQRARARAKLHSTSIPRRPDERQGRGGRVSQVSLDLTHVFLARLLRL